MRKTLLAATLALAGQLLAGGFYLQLGNPEASPEDRALTRRLVSAGEIMGIRVLDHVIIGDRQYVSFADQWWLTP